MNKEKVSWKISDPSGNPIVGIIPTCIIVRVTDGYIFDWNDLSFKSSGWTIKSNNFTETDSTNIPGLYGIMFDVSTFNDGYYQFYGTYQGTYGQTSEYEFNILNGSLATLSRTESQNISNIPTQVRASITNELSHLMMLQNGMGLDSVQAIMLLEMYRLHGLDPTMPLIVTDNKRVAGDLAQTITSNATYTTILRI
jgi:hypothetical protein